MDDTDQRLARREAADHLFADGLFLDLRNEIPDDRKRDVGFQQRYANLAQGILDVGIGQTPLTAQCLDDTGPPAGKAV